MYTYIYIICIHIEYSKRIRGCIIQINVVYNDTTKTINPRNIIFIKNTIICRS